MSSLTLGSNPTKKPLISHSSCSWQKTLALLPWPAGGQGPSQRMPSVLRVSSRSSLCHFRTVASFSGLAEGEAMPLHQWEGVGGGVWRRGERCGCSVLLPQRKAKAVRMILEWKNERFHPPHYHLLPFSLLEPSIVLFCTIFVVPLRIIIFSYLISYIVPFY